MGDAVKAVLVILLSLAASFGTTFLTASIKKGVSANTRKGATRSQHVRAVLLKLVSVPQVLWFLACGMLFNRLSPSIMSPNNAPKTRPFIDFALSVIGLQLGSHLNAKSVGPLKWELLKFLALFFPLVFFTVSIGTGLMFPQFVFFAPLIGSIALERSSPEALAGITEARAAGPFTTSTMCVAAIQDVIALVGYVLFSAFLKQEDQATTLNGLIGMLVATSAAIVIGVAVIRFLTPLAGTSISLALTVIIFVSINHRWDSELLLSAVLTGVIVNWSQQHTVTRFIEDSEQLVSLVLFTIIGLRINILTYAAEGLPAVGIFVLRLFGLAVGGYFGARVAKWSHPESRWLGLVTQLAIALTLVQRMEEQFPVAATLARATGASVLLALSFGPPALQFVLQRVGEADKQLLPTTTAAREGSPVLGGTEPPVAGNSSMTSASIGMPRDESYVSGTESVGATNTRHREMVTI